VAVTHLDLKGLKCPLPVLRTRKALRLMTAGDRLVVLASDPLAGLDIPNLLRETGDRLERQEADGDVIVFHIVKGG
jgi:tRNA 2-thiouridine synthesizing protein A